VILTDELNSLRELVTRFAGEHVAPRTDLYQRTSFPEDLHSEFARENLYGIGIPVAYRGMGGGWLHMAVAGQALVESGLNLGVALSWLMHVLLSRFVFFGFGTDEQKFAYLPSLATGACTPCLAISEPGVGGHPAKLTTSARKEGRVYRITGEKAYLTNGPIADLYVVLAITSEHDSRKGYTAFIVPSGTPGLRRTEPLDLGFLRPCPHGGIVLDGCEVVEENILGLKGHAYPDVALAFRRIEDVMMMAPFVGGARAQLSLIAKALGAGGEQLDRDTASLLGEAVSTIDSLEVLANEAANLLDQYRIDHPGLASMALFMRQTAGTVQERISEIVQISGIDPGQPFRALAYDIGSSLRIAANVARITREKLGRSLLC
jgi:alkylation response protein AidB-like acyl-CoA dehydrogenase